MPKKASANSDIAEASDMDTDRLEAMLMRITKSITQSFNSCVDKLIGALDQKLTTKIDYQNTELFNMNKRMDILDKQVVDLQRENQGLKDSVKSLLTRIEASNLEVDNLEQYTKSDNLLIHGIPLPIDGSKESDIRQLVVDVLGRNMTNIGLNKDSISMAHRLSTKQLNQVSSSNPSSRSTRPPPIIVRFNQREMRNNLLVNRRQLKGKQLSISEQLTYRRSQLLKKASELVAQNKLDSSWSHDGRILVKSKSNQIVVINSDMDLIQFN